MGWNEVTSDAHGGKMLSTMTMETDSAGSAETDSQAVSADYRLFQREVGPFLILLSATLMYILSCIFWLAVLSLYFIIAFFLSFEQKNHVSSSDSCVV